MFLRKYVRPAIATCRMDQETEKSREDIHILNYSNYLTFLPYVHKNCDVVLVVLVFHERSC